MSDEAQDINDVDCGLLAAILRTFENGEEGPHTKGMRATRRKFKDVTDALRAERDELRDKLAKVEDLVLDAIQNHAEAMTEGVYCAICRDVSAALAEKGIR